MNLDQISQISRETPFSLSQASSVIDGSYIRPFGLDTGHDVAGWELYDGNRKSGTLLLGIDDRVGVLVEGTNIFPNVLLEIAHKMNFKEIDRAIKGS